MPIPRPAGGHDEAGSTLLQLLLGSAGGTRPGAPVAGAAALPACSPLVPPARPALPSRPGTGSSLLDTLLQGEAGNAAIHYPLLDALGEAQRGGAAGASERYWPAARVEIALPELLGRVAAGLHAARSAA